MNVGSYNCCDSSSSEFKKISPLSDLLKIVSEESRLRLLYILLQGEHCVCEMMEHVKMSQSLISHHLSDLKQVGLAMDEKRGQRVYYSLTSKGERITRLLFGISQKEVAE